MVPKDGLRLIFYVKDGKVNNSDTHKELLDKCIDYKELYNYEIIKQIMLI